jgi:Xaa-Pro aminopeptidase
MTAADPYGVDVAAARGRQQRLLAEMQRLELDLAIVTQIEHVQWLIGPRTAWLFSPCAALAADGRATLVVPQKFDEPAAADEVVHYDAKWHSTLRNDQREVSSAALLRALSARPRAARIGVEFGSCPPYVTTAHQAEWVDIEPTLYRLRRRKDRDELARLEKAIAATGRMYERARQIVAPGVNELTVFSQLQEAAVDELGEMLTGTGNDYTSGRRGGPPRNRPIEAGELYILDLGPAFRGYFADNCRTISVDGRPTEEQERACASVQEALRLVEREARPGKSCRELFHQVQELLDRAAPWTFDHHLGHGIGLFPHEAPHLNPFWDDVFQEGEVFTAEPGLYHPDLCAGIRLENDYLVTADGVRLLSDFPLGLV